MKIKRFVAPDMRTAFAMVREEQGPDAVILSNRVIDEGIEIVAASNYDESLVQRALEATRPATPAPALPGQPAPRQHDDRRAPSPAEAAAAYFSRVTAPAAATALAPSAEAQPSPGEAQQPASRRDQHNTVDTATTRTANTGMPLPPAWLQATHAPLPAQDSMSSFAAALAASLPPAPVTASMAPDSGAAGAQSAQRPVAQPQPHLAVDPVEQMPDHGDSHAAHCQSVAPSVAEHGVCPSPPLTAVATDTQPSAGENDAQLVQMRAELASMREMIEREMHRLTDERLRGSPARAQALELMDDYGFDAGISRDVALQIPADTELHRGRGLMLGLLSRKLPITELDPLASGGVIALVGPTGAGKTTTIAKLAASYAALHNPRDVALVTTDTIRVGGREQLHSYGRQLGIAVHEADSDTQLAQVLERLRDYKLVLIDTAGLGQRDRNLVGQLNWLRSAGQVQTLLVLPANSHFSDLDEVVRRFRAANPQGVVLTKLDETGRLGSALSVVVDHQLPMAWVTDGQRVPEDLHRANSAHLVLRLDQLRREADEPCPAEAIHVA
ncbi:flagellar biosynthesis protein FlhF [Pseudoxanthomonas dokdonensis]|uniref:Flagellar biosynthesis protein FlhF n=1 Tax=Pseudoxanthomonas dokdonensis TaxID=344882 RepID=A0A0R0CMZ1_9GAMM|nr:flagellar biosynthesis protein FlhF [Pseudoxanthomonas dokdonensis]KRG71045.1 flagellar biosynthesis regulator FlhF [Pseudoxanthomonas dokdonensis]